MANPDFEFFDFSKEQLVDLAKHMRDEDASVSILAHYETVDTPGVGEQRVLYFQIFGFEPDGIAEPGLADFGKSND